MKSGLLAVEKEIIIPAGRIRLEGTLTIPQDALGIVLFAHGSGSSRHSPRNQYVAQALHGAGIGSLLFDLLTAEEDVTYETRFDIGLLTRRLKEATSWLEKNPAAQEFPLAYFGASTGAAAALIAAAELGPMIRAVVSRGGRPDLAMESLDRVVSPTLLIVGGNDDVVIELNRQAYARLGGIKKLEIVPGATHLFEEPGALEEVARLAAEWFAQYLPEKGTKK